MTVGDDELRMRESSFDARWRSVLVATVGLLVASVVPSPVERRADWRWVGPDKLLHFLGHAWYARVLANAIDTDRERAGAAAALALCLSTAHGVLSGRLQQRVPGRAFERADVAWAFAGSAVAALSWYTGTANDTTRTRSGDRRSSR